MAATEVFPTTIYASSAEERPEYGVTRVQFGGRYSQRVRQGVINKKQKIWDVVFADLTDAQDVTVMAFLDARDGGMEAFLWTPPKEATQIQVTLAEQSLRRIPTGHQTYTISATFIQEFDL